MTTKGILAFALAIAMAPAANAAVTCSARTPAAITLPAAGSQKCQDTIAKEGAKFLKAKLKILSKCNASSAGGVCPLAADTTAIEAAATKSADKIAKACGDDAVQAGLSTTYNAGSDETVIGSCMLSQQNVVGEKVIAVTQGPTTEVWPGSGKERADCVKELSKTGIKLFNKALGTANKCLKGQAKAGTPGNLAPICVGSFDGGGAFVAPTDAKTAAKQAKLLEKSEEAIAKKCGAAETANQIASLFGCAGAKTVADLQACIVCNGMNSVFDAIENGHSERGQYVANGPGALQLAVGTGTAAAAANAGKKFLVGSGTYQEEVTIFQGGDGISVVGCGGATNDRPRIIPPVTEVAGRGIQAANVDNLTFQSLDFYNQANDHLRVTLGDNITFRDITGDGNRNTAYAVFPINCNNVLVELCKVRRQNDAPIYVGQSSGIVVRNNDVREGVAGIEIENSGNAQVYANYGTGNTGGLLVFKDGNLPLQLSECHDVHHNLFENNNEPNFGSGSVAGVPTGTGILVISSDSTTYHYNWLRGNNTVGLVLTDQFTAGFHLSAPGDPRTINDNWVYKNVMSGNGTSPDGTNWPLPFGYDFAYLALDPGGTSGHCENGNVFTTELGFATFASTTPPVNNNGTCNLLVGPTFPECPAPPIP
ncbi:MAG: parallel beta-helix domain-containing protein [Deltaproteobacteria bacterium]|nr:parallel beta-helix domain-containing protein [Deltaproteobacteria bacterium]